MVLVTILLESMSFHDLPCSVVEHPGVHADTVFTHLLSHVVIYETLLWQVDLVVIVKVLVVLGARADVTIDHVLLGLHPVVFLLNLSFHVSLCSEHWVCYLHRRIGPQTTLHLD